MRPTTVTQAGVGTSATMVHDSSINITDISLSTVCTGQVNYDIQHTFDNVLDLSYVAASGNWWNSHDPALSGATQGLYSKVDQPISASRIVNRGTGTVALTAIQGVKG